MKKSIALLVPSGNISSEKDNNYVKELIALLLLVPWSPFLPPTETKGCNVSALAAHLLARRNVKKS